MENKWKERDWFTIPDGMNDSTQIFEVKSVEPWKEGTQWITYTRVDGNLCGIASYLIKRVKTSFEFKEPGPMIGGRVYQMGKPFIVTKEQMEAFRENQAKAWEAAKKMPYGSVVYNTEYGQELFNSWEEFAARIDKIGRQPSQGYPEGTQVNLADPEVLKSETPTGYIDTSVGRMKMPPTKMEDDQFLEILDKNCGSVNITLSGNLRILLPHDFDPDSVITIKHTGPGTVTIQNR